MPNIESRVSTLEELMVTVLQNMDKRDAEAKQRDEQYRLDQQRRDQQYKLDQGQRDEKYRLDQQQRDKEYAKRNEEFKREEAEFRRKMNKKWSDLAKKMGTIVEDIVAPNIPRIAHEYFGLPSEPLRFSVRTLAYRAADHSQQREFDVIAVYDDAVVLNETKSTARSDWAKEFVEFLPHLTKYFPEFDGKRIIPVFASLAIPANVTAYLSKHSIYAMAMGDETMEILNAREVNLSHISPRKARRAKARQTPPAQQQKKTGTK
jgi:hypothetical protein